MMYSPPLVTAATHAIRLALGTEPQDDGDGVRDAVRRLCADARRQGVRPEELVVLVKMTWRAHPQISGQPRNHASPPLEHIISMCIDEYFRDPVAR